MKTAVEYLLEELKELGALHIDGLHWSDQDDVKKSINQAKEIEKEQAELYAEFAILSDRSGNPVIPFNEFINIDNL